MTPKQTAQAELIAVFKFLFTTQNREAQRYGLEILERVAALEAGRAEPHKLDAVDLCNALGIVKQWQREKGKAA